MTNNITQQTRTVVQNFYQALAKRDLETIIDLFSETVDWNIPGNTAMALWLGKRTNKQQVKDFFELLWHNIEPISAQIDHILVEADFAVATGDFSSQMLKTGKIYSSMFSAHFTVKNNLIVRYRLQEDSDGLVQALS